MDNLKNLILTAKDLDEKEREISLYASKLWDQICWALEPSEKSKLIAQLNQANEDLKSLYAARVDLYAKN